MPDDIFEGAEHNESDASLPETVEVSNDPDDGDQQTDDAASGASECPPDWREAVAPYLLKLARRITEQGRRNHSISFPIGRCNILVSPREQDLVLDAATGSSSEEEHHRHSLDAIGLSILIAVAVRKFERSGEDRHRERLECGVRWGFLLAHTMTVEMRTLRDAGMMEESGELQDARRLLTTVIEKAETLLESGRPPRPAGEGSAGDQRFVYDWDSLASSSPDHRSVTTSRIRTIPTVEKPENIRRKKIILAVLAVIFGAILVNLWLNRERQLPGFDVEDFPEVPGIEQVINRSPVLLIVVSDARWTAADRWEREQAMTSIVEKIRPVGYRRAEIRSKISPLLASWNGGRDFTFYD